MHATIVALPLQAKMVGVIQLGLFSGVSYYASAAAYYLPTRLGGGYVAYNPAGRSEDQLWADASPNTRLPREDPAQTGARVLAATNALKALGGRNAGVIDAILNVNNGERPRAVGLPAAEDALSGGHTDDRHVFTTGGGVNNIYDLAMRVARHKLSTGANAPCPKKAGAFANPAAAQRAIQQALEKDWRIWRTELSKGAGGNLQRLITGIKPEGTVLIKSDPSPPNKYPAAQLPPYANPPHGHGGRPMHPGEDFKTKMAPYKVAPTSYAGKALDYLGFGHTYQHPDGTAIVLDSGNPLTKKVKPTGVEIRLLHSNVLARGGFTIHSAWPS